MADARPRAGVGRPLVGSRGQSCGRRLGRTRRHGHDRDLELGADDYITKPFVPAELCARVRAVLRRSSTDGGDPSEELRGQDIIVDEAAFRSFRGGDELRLTTIEFRLLAELVRNAGRVLTRERLLERVWGYDYLGDSRLVDMAVKRLRAKLGDAPGDGGCVTTVRGVGYRFEPG